MVLNLETRAGPGPGLRGLGLDEMVLDGVPTLEVSGDLDLLSAAALRSALLRHVSRPALTCDLRGVEFIDSSGIEVLLDVRRISRTKGCALTVLPSRAVRRVVELLDLEDYLLGDKTKAVPPSGA